MITLILLSLIVGAVVGASVAWHFSYHANWLSAQPGLYKVKLSIGNLKSWIWTLIMTNRTAPRYCSHLKERMMCSFCPENVVEHESQIITSYCRIASKLREKGVLK